MNEEEQQEGLHPCRAADRRRDHRRAGCYRHPDLHQPAGEEP